MMEPVEAPQVETAVSLSQEVLLGKALQPLSPASLHRVEVPQQLQEVGVQVGRTDPCTALSASNLGTQPKTALDGQKRRRDPTASSARGWVTPSMNALMGVSRFPAIIVETLDILTRTAQWRELDKGEWRNGSRGHSKRSGSSGKLAFHWKKMTGKTLTSRRYRGRTLKLF